MHGVTHFEIPVDDMERAKKFYTKVFGWLINAVPGMGEDHQLATTTPSDEKGIPKEPGVINGGLFQRGERGDRV